MISKDIPHIITSTNRYPLTTHFKIYTYKNNQTEKQRYKIV